MIDPAKLSFLQGLAPVGNTGRGALEYRPDYRVPSLDYSDLLQVCHILTKNMEEVYRLFRQIVFNIAIKNRDAHATNVSFQLINGEWKLLQSTVAQVSEILLFKTFLLTEFSMCLLLK